MFEKRFELGCEEKHLSIEKIFERLHADSVARAENAPALFIVDCECKHAAKMREAIGPEFFVKPEENFGIRLRTEHVTSLFEHFPLFLVVIDFTIECNDGIAVTGNHRLSSRIGEIDDLKSAMSQTDIPIDEDSPTIRSAMRESIGDAIERITINRSAIEVNDTGNTAHTYTLYHSLRRNSAKRPSIRAAVSC